MDAVYQAARRDPRWIEAHRRLAAKRTSGEAAIVALRRRMAAIEDMHTVESELQKAAQGC